MTNIQFPVPGLLLAHGTKFAGSSLVQSLSDLGLQLQQVASPEDLVGLNPALLLLDAGLTEVASLEEWRADGVDFLVLAEEHLNVDADYLLPSGMPERVTVASLAAAAREWALARQQQEMEAALGRSRTQLVELNQIGIALSAERSLPRLLRMILDKASRLASCDAASLFLVDNRDPDDLKLLFKLTKNDSVDINFKEFSLPLNEESIAGYVALSGRVQNIPDCYELPDDVTYGFNRSFDESVGYRTRSMLVIPMENHRGEVIGVLQFINRKDEYDYKLKSPEDALEHTLPFDEATANTLHALASQAAVAIQNAFLLESINQLFDGFVQAAVMAIEQRDPTTSGHSFRVADFTVAIAQALPRSNMPGLRECEYDESQLREIRYASLLHDFGKVGVREHVLVKSKKLPASRLEMIRYRVALEKERVRVQALERQLSVGGDKTAQQEVLAKLDEEVSRLEGFLAAVEQANEPSILPDGTFDHLREVHEYRFSDVDGEVRGLINDEELLALSVRKGSLTEHERKEIESHVTHTWNFLKLIPWTPELRGIPEIAGKHHEKLDGTGYPTSCDGEGIPLQTRMMTISDIFDALTASDRPYKPAMPTDRALNILEMESKSGKLDKDLVQVFIESKSFRAADGKEYGSTIYSPDGIVYAHHVCDVDLDEHLP